MSTSSPFFIFLGLSIVDVLKLIKSRKRSNSNLTTIDFGNIHVQDVKYLPLSLEGVVLFVLSLVSTGVHGA